MNGPDLPDGAQPAATSQPPVDAALQTGPARQADEVPEVGRRPGPGTESAQAAASAAAEDHLEPEASLQTQTPAVNRPEAFRLAAEPPRVMRLSPKALAIMALVAGIGLGGALIYGLRGIHGEPPVNLIDTSHNAKSDVVTANPSTYDKVPKLGQPMPGDLGGPILAAQQNGTMVAGANGNAQAAATDQRQVAAQQARERAAEQRATVLGSRLFLAGSTAQAGTGTGAGTGAAAGSSLPSGMSDASAGSGGQAKGSGTSDQSAKRAFMTVAGSRTYVSSERISQASSPYVVQAGSVIAAALMTGIRSDLPGQLTAQVTQNVYDSPTGRILLIPQGSRLIGEYDSQISAGQNRVLMAWDRLILPDGRSILLDRQPGADASGAAGLQDKTNYHWGNLLRAAAISAMLGVGTDMTTNGNDQLTQALRYGTQDTINQTGKQLVQRELNVPPTLTIRPGYPLRVVLTRDLVLEAEGKER